MGGGGGRGAKVSGFFITKDLNKKKFWSFFPGEQGGGGGGTRVSE